MSENRRGEIFFLTHTVYMPLNTSQWPKLMNEWQHQSTTDLSAFLWSNVFLIRRYTTYWLYWN